VGGNIGQQLAERRPEINTKSMLRHGPGRNDGEGGQKIITQKFKEKSSLKENPAGEREFLERYLRKQLAKRLNGRKRKNGGGSSVL